MGIAERTWMYSQRVSSRGLPRPSDTKSEYTSPWVLSAPAQTKILPGFMMLFGSNTALIDFITAISASLRL